MKKLSETLFGKTLGRKGLLLTFAVFLLAIGGAGLAAYNHAVDKINDSLTFSVPDTDSSKSGNTQADNKQSGVEKDESSKKDESSMAVKTQPNVMPVNGEVIKPFSNGELVKSETLGVWKTHDGIDIKAEAGTQVKAMNKGTVTKVSEDPLWGNCIIIDHGDGLEGHYCSLSKTMTVTEGDEVVSGQVIGSVGDTAQIEAAEPSHLHFGLKRNGKWIDPVAFINPNSNK